MVLQRVWEPCAVLRYVVEVLPLAGLPLPGLKWSGGEKEEDNGNGQKSGTGDEGVKDLMGRWASFSLSEIVLCRDGG